MAQVTGGPTVKRSKKKGKLHRVTIERAKNGVTIQRHHQSPEGPYMGHSPEDPMVFDDHAKAMAHVGKSMKHMMPGSSDHDGDEAA